MLVLCDGDEGEVAEGEVAEGDPGDVVEGVVPWDPACGSLGVVWANATSPSTRVKAIVIAICFMLHSSISNEWFGLASFLKNSLESLLVLSLWPEKRWRVDEMAGYFET